MDYDEAHVLVHDALRAQVEGVPHGCLLVAARSRPADNQPATPEPEAAQGSEAEPPLSADEPAASEPGVPSLLLMRVLGSSPLPNDIEMQQARLHAGQRASDSPHNWDEQNNSDQFTLHQVRYAGLRCAILGTLSVALAATGKWHLSFGADIDNFYAGQGMKVYKPVRDAL